MTPLSQCLINSSRCCIKNQSVRWGLSITACACSVPLASSLFCNSHCKSGQCKSGQCMSAALKVKSTSTSRTTFLFNQSQQFLQPLIPILIGTLHFRHTPLQPLFTTGMDLSRSGRGSALVPSCVRHGVLYTAHLP